MSRRRHHCSPANPSIHPTAAPSIQPPGTTPRSSSTPRATPRSRSRAEALKDAAARWAADATPRGQEAKTYLVREVIPVLLPAMVRLVKTAEVGHASCRDVGPADPLAAFDTQSVPLRNYMQKTVVPVLSKCLESLYQTQVSSRRRISAKKNFGVGLAVSQHLDGGYQP